MSSLNPANAYAKLKKDFLALDADLQDAVWSYLQMPSVVHGFTEKALESAIVLLKEDGRLRILWIAVNGLNGTNESCPFDQHGNMLPLSDVIFVTRQDIRSSDGDTTIFFHMIEDEETAKRYAEERGLVTVPYVPQRQLDIANAALTIARTEWGWDEWNDNTKLLEEGRKQLDGERE